MATVTVVVRNHTRAASAAVHRRAELATKKAAYDIEGHAKTRAPVRTGHLKTSIQASGHGLDWRVDSPANYSLYVEFGTRHMGAQPYLLPASESVKPSFIAAMRRLA